MTGNDKRRYFGACTALRKYIIALKFVAKYASHLFVKTPLQRSYGFHAMSKTLFLRVRP